MGRDPRDEDPERQPRPGTKSPAVGPEERAVLAAPALVGPPVLVRGINHLAGAQSGGMVAEAVRIRAVVQADLVLALLAVIARVADTPRHREFDRTVPAMRTVVRAVPYRTIIVDKRRRTLAGPESVANAVGFSK